ncbi:ABC transporter permease subunit [Deinococcus lacus]|uniref:ABC transporter permease subunit n=1 Tax=Deinococcus lacus TaxID=392561 RepID=A0ABW1YA66_9DEIO
MRPPVRPEMVWRVAARDLLTSLRDTRTLVSTILIPLLLIPLLMVGLPLVMGKFIGGQAEGTQRVGVMGTLPPQLQRSLQAGNQGSGGLELTPWQGSPAEARAAVQAGDFAAVVRAVQPLPPSGSAPATLEVYAKLGSLAAQTGTLPKVEAAVNSYNRLLAAQKLAAAGLSERDLEPVTLQKEDASTVQESRSGQLAFLIPLLMLNFILSGAMATALDSTAGEKERGTLESLLVSPVRRVKWWPANCFRPRSLPWQRPFLACWDSWEQGCWPA